jgi:plastocyanin
MRRLTVFLGLLSAIVVVTPATPALAGGGGGCYGERREVSGTTVDIAEFCFTQTVVHVSPGQSVTWTNRDTVEHTVTGVAREWGDYEPMRAGATVSNRFDKAGVYPYFCVFHPGMVGAVVVDASTAVPAAAVRLAPTGGSGGSAIAWVVGGVLTVTALLFGAVYGVARRRPAAMATNV